MVDGHRLTIETRDGISRLLCGECEGKRHLPFLEIVNGKIRLEAKHGSAKHVNILTAEDLRLIALVMWRQTHPPKEFW